MPWFWSNQYDLKLQTVALSTGHDACSPFDCVNATKDYVQGRKLVVDRLSPDPAALADAATPLKELTA